MRVFATTAILTLIAGCATDTTAPSTESNRTIDAAKLPSSSSTASGSADESMYRPPAPGLELTYNSKYTGEPDSKLRQVVVVSGEDYAVFANILEDGLSGPQDLFVEYSGIYWQDCTQTPISDYQRRKLADMWPLETGETTSMPFLGDLSKQMSIEIGEWKTVSVEGVGEFKAVEVINSYEEVDISNFAPELGYAIRIDWGDPDMGQALGHDELVGVSSVDLDDFQDYVDMANTTCMK